MSGEPRRDEGDGYESEHEGETVVGAVFGEGGQERMPSGGNARPVSATADPGSASDMSSGDMGPGTVPHTRGNDGSGAPLAHTAEGRATIRDFLTRDAWTAGSRPSSAETYSDGGGLTAPRTGVDTTVATVTPGVGVANTRTTVPVQDDAYSDLSDEQVRDLAAQLEQVRARRLLQRSGQMQGHAAPASAVTMTGPRTLMGPAAAVPPTPSGTIPVYTGTEPRGAGDVNPFVMGNPFLQTGGVAAGEFTFGGAAAVSMAGGQPAMPVVSTAVPSSVPRAMPQGSGVP